MFLIIMIRDFVPNECGSYEKSGIKGLFGSGQQQLSDRLELLAVVRGLEALDQPSRVTLVTRSRYVSRGLRFGIREWRENDWKWEHYGDYQPINNSDLWQRVDHAMTYHKVECRTWRFDSSHIPGESDSSEPESANKQVDEAAVTESNHPPTEEESSPISQMARRVARQVGRIFARN